MKIMVNYEELPLLTSFKNLKWKDKVYSTKFGLGVVKSLFREDQIIVNFIGRTERIALEDSDLKAIPNELTVRKRATSTMMVNGIKMGRRKMIKYMRDGK